MGQLRAPPSARPLTDGLSGHVVLVAGPRKTFIKLPAGTAGEHELTKWDLVMTARRQSLLGSKVGVQRPPSNGSTVREGWPPNLTASNSANLRRRPVSRFLS